jgi:CheY-like chemotaxis protein
MALRGKRVLIVEDEYLIAINLASEVAASGGMVVEMVQSIDAALDIIATADLDGAIVDIDLMGQQTFRVADAPARHANILWLGKPWAPGAVGHALAGAMRVATRAPIEPESGERDGVSS